MYPDNTETGEEYDSISDFYANQHVFCTGSTGMLGTAYLATLALRTPVSRIFALVRGGEDRLWSIWDRHLPPEIIQALKSSNKIAGIDGDVTLPDCGLDEENLHIIRCHATIILHAASTINLKSSLSKVAPLVVHGSLNVAKLALGCTSMTKFIYISSAYASTFFREEENGRFSGADAMVKEDIIPIRSEHASLEAELADLDSFGTTPEYGFVRHLHAYTYAKHLTERLLLRKFEEVGAPDSLLIIRPSLIGPAEELPTPHFEIPGSSPVTFTLAAVLIMPPWKMRFSSFLKDPSQATLNEVPVDIVVNRIVVHTALGTTGCVHAVADKDSCRKSEFMWKQMNTFRRFLLGSSQLVWCEDDWNSGALCPLAKLFPACGSAFVFDETQSHYAWKLLNTEERSSWPLWARIDLKDLKYMDGRRRSVEILVGKLLAKQYGLRESWASFFCHNVGRLASQGNDFSADY